MARSPEMMQVFLSLKERDKITPDDNAIETFSTLWGVSAESASDYAKNNVQAIHISALDPRDVDVATQLIEERQFRYEQDTIIPESLKYIPLLNVAAVYMGPDNYLEALTNMCNLARDIIERCRPSMPGF